MRRMFGVALFASSLLCACAEGTGNGSGSSSPPPPGMARLSLSFTGSGSGHAVSTPAGLDCRSDCSAAFATGTPVTLQASPDAGSRFAGFGGACGGTTCALAVSSDATVFVDFEPNAPSACAGLGFGTLPGPQVYGTNPGF